MADPSGYILGWFAAFVGMIGFGSFAGKSALVLFHQCSLHAGVQTMARGPCLFYLNLVCLYWLPLHIICTNICYNLLSFASSRHELLITLWRTFWSMWTKEWRIEVACVWECFCCFSEELAATPIVPCRIHIPEALLDDLDISLHSRCSI